MRIVETATASQMAALYLTARELETTPEPFRRQGNVAILTNFLEYQTFIDVYLQTYDWLGTPTSILKFLLEADNERVLFQSFMKDTAIAVCKELYYAENACKPATAIVHQVNDAPIISTRNILDEYDKLPEAITKQLKAYMLGKDYPLPKYISERNKNHWCYACVCWFRGMIDLDLWNVDYGSLFPEK